MTFLEWLAVAGLIALWALALCGACGLIRDLYRDTQE